MITKLILKNLLILIIICSMGLMGCKTDDMLKEESTTPSLPSDIQHFKDTFEGWQATERLCSNSEFNENLNLTILTFSELRQYKNEYEKLPYMPDIGEYWQSSCETIERGAGDCEDSAILQYMELRSSGLISDDDLMIAVLKYRNSNRFHAVTRIKITDDDGNKKWFLLENNHGMFEENYYLEKNNRIMHMTGNLFHIWY